MWFCCISGADRAAIGFPYAARCRRPISPRLPLTSAGRDAVHRGREKAAKTRPGPHRAILPPLSPPSRRNCRQDWRAHPYGANNALIYAATHPDQIKSVALFSPGANYHGLDALAPARKFKGAVVIYHDKNDAIAGSGPKQVTQALTGRDHILRLSTGSEHGTNLLSPANIRDAASFFQRTLK